MKFRRSLIKCAECTLEISRNAEYCPHCGSIASKKNREARQDANKEMPCKACGAMLLILKHRSTSHSSSIRWKRGTSFKEINSSVHYTKCPKCGEPEPIVLFGDKAIHKVAYFCLLLFVLSTIFVIGFTQIYFMIPVIVLWYWFGSVRYPSVFY